MIFSSLVSVVALASLVTAHPGEIFERKSDAEIDRRELAARDRHIAARNCANQIRSFNARRKAKRNLLRRADSSDVASSTATAETPHYTSLQNTTCVTAPEVTEGPYYINNELVRNNLTEDQPGVELVMDIGVLDITTCEPLGDAFVEIWHANATGVYGGYPATLDVSGLGPPPTGSDTSAGAAPTGGGAPGSLSLVRNETWLRGGFASDSNGIVELTTVYPGFYEGRTAHIHVMVHSNWTESDNGTIVSHSGSLQHIGQFFFEESWNDQVFAVAPYNTNTNNRTLNADDSILQQENSDGNDAYMDLELLGDAITDGILAYITVGVNASASYTITNTNYFNSSTDDVAAAAQV